ncbi:hypothetical protein BC936DRAFT_149614 [Jimgerdemannia flammicorona]|uniref:Uncharacterized protein n=2 Tax=Jimgerdemannia flammicorona TaxID=994334 RepID=A0A433D0H4_9FUNG|nr:hypothetical protein BC936DRAFT_149614 [Jimgerdemannia flammicorona]RUS27868.1 hypothetical protein BC938DRAFT_482622 [Jimgerdemannia flammicorona]
MLRLPSIESQFSKQYRNVIRTLDRLLELGLLIGDCVWGVFRRCADHALRLILPVTQKKSISIQQQKRDEKEYSGSPASIDEVLTQMAESVAVPASYFTRRIE